MSSKYRSTPLYGGAITCDLPKHFADVRSAKILRVNCRAHSRNITLTNIQLHVPLCSKLRQVPDNQEVWIDKDGFTSIIFEITERVGEPGSGPEIDGRAMTTHLEDMVGSDINTVKIWNTAETEFSRMQE